MEREFKVGDRVVFNKGMQDEDFGVVTNCAEHLIYADWESDGQNLFAYTSQLQHTEPEVDFEVAFAAFIKEFGSSYIQRHEIETAFADIKQWFIKMNNDELEAAKALCESKGFKVTPC